MADTLKTLGQAAPGALALTDFYTVPALTQATVSSIAVCNRGATATTFRVSVAVAGAANDPKQALYFDLPIPANDCFIATVGLTLGPGDVLRCYAGNANLTFQAWGVEVT